MSDAPSMMHGTNDMSMAVFPTFLRADLLMPSPARVRITISAKDFKNGESSQRISGELSLIKTEQRMPKMTIPRTAGSLIFENSFEKIHPPANMITKIRLRLRSIKIPLKILECGNAGCLNHPKAFFVFAAVL